MNAEKVIGYFLLIVGVVVIGLSTFSVYQVFTGQKKPPQPLSFEMPGITLPAQQGFDLKLPEGMSLPEEMVEGLSGGGKESSELKLLPDEAINNIANMSIYLFLMGFVASSGAKIASIGVRMIKDIKVVVKEEKIKQASS